TPELTQFKARRRHLLVKSLLLLKISFRLTVYVLKKIQTVISHENSEKFRIWNNFLFYFTLNNYLTSSFNTIKVVDLAGVKKPALKKVRMSADAMLKALLGSKHTVNMDLRANLKQVKKEVKEEVKAVGDWRKNIEDKADRKKMFETS
uniref:Troponin I2, fast skeletal type n=1 Tax=Seriola lalandi dorsalis TaxID=1841481 RepID=A0A3B4YGR2_SERLL